MPAVTPTRYRMMFLLLGVALVLVVMFAVVFAPGGGEFTLPEAIDNIEPGNNETVQRQIDLVVDMAVGYRIELFIDGVRIPDDEIAVTPATGRHVWRPGVSSTFGEWTSGLHSVLVNYESISGTIDVGSVGWVFRVQ